MEEKINIKANYFYNIFYQILSLITPLITAPYIARVLGVDAIGQYSFTQSIVMYFCLISALGSGTHGQRGIARLRNDPSQMSVFFYEVVILRIFTTIFSLLLFFTYILLFGKKYFALFAIQSITVIANAFDISWFYQGLENFKYTVTRQIIIKLLSITSILLFVKTKDDLILYAALYSIPILIGNLLLWSKVNQYVSKVVVNKLNPMKHFKEEITLFVPYIATMLFSYVDKTMIGHFAINGNKENGYYEQALKFIIIAANVVSAFSTVLIPRMVSYFKMRDNVNIQKYLKQGIQLIMMVSAILFCGMFLVGKNLIPWFYGVEYIKCVDILKVLSFVIIFKGMNALFGGAILIPRFQQNKYSTAVWTTAVFNICFNYLLIPKYGAIGASIISVMSEVLQFILLTFFSRDVISVRKLISYSYKPLVSAVATIIIIDKIVNNFASNFLNSMLLSGLCCFVYVLGLLLLKEDMILKFFTNAKVMM
ncbi:flippase [Enterococcus faecium]|uniref:flippase n=1 Tax=Enterococcus faecium TaxID=1352 RepID=UPI0010C19ECA|nr:flippase [Enterococcus faecium]TKM14646.1 flippase [Enterococcus faecium]